MVKRMAVWAALAVFGVMAWGEPSRCALGEAKFMSWAPRDRPWTLKAGLLHLDAKPDVATSFEFNRKNDARFVSGFASGPRFRITFAYRATAKATLRLESAPMDTPVEGLERQTKDLSPVSDWTDVVWEPKATALDRQNTDLVLACAKGTGFVEVKDFAVTDVAPEDRSGKPLLVNGSRVTEVCLYETDAPRRRLNDLRSALMFRYALRQAGGEWLPVRTVAKAEEAGANAVLVGRLAVDAGVVAAAEQAKVEGLTGGWATAAKGARLGLAGAVPCGVQRGAWRVLERLGIVYLGSDLFKPFAGKAFETGDFAETKIPAIAFHTCREDYRSGLNDELRGQVSRDCLMGAHAIGSVPERPKLAEDSLGFIVPVSEFRESHPEYFALQKDGTRLTDDAHSKGLTHYCWTAPGLAELIAERYLEMMRALPEQAVWILAPGDGGGCNCTCANCRALGSDSDGLVRLANRVAEVISKEFPENSILIYSYVDTPEPPTNPVKAHPNLNIGYCVYPTEYWPSCMIHPHPSNEKGMKALAGWRRDCQPRMGLFGYFQQCGEWMNCWPGFDADVWMMRDFAEHRAFMTWIWGLTPTHRVWINETSGFTDLTIYVLSQLAVDPSLDARKLANEFIDCFYGVSAKPMRRVFDLATAEPRKRDWVQNCEQHKPGFITKEFADEVLPLLDEAERLAGDDAALAQRIRKQTILFYWTYLNGVNRGNGSVSAAELKPWAQRAARFVRACKANGSWYFQDPKRWFHDKLMLGLTTSDGWEENWTRAPEIAQLLEDPENTLGRKLDNRQTATKDGFLIPAMGMTGGEFGSRKAWQIDLRIVRRPTSGAGIVMTRLDLDAVPKGKTTMFLKGVDNDHAPVAEIRVKINDAVVYAGPVKWGKKGHDEWAIEIPSGVLQAGENEIIVQNTTADTEKDGEGGDRFRAKRNYYWGWFMLDSIRFAMR